MKRKKVYTKTHLYFAILLITAVLQTWAFGQRIGWQKEQADWRLGGARVKAISYPQDKPTTTSGRRGAQKPKKAILSLDALQTVALDGTGPSSLRYAGASRAASVLTNVIDSPAIDGFVSWIAVSVTNARSDIGELEAVTQYSITGSFLTGTPESDYAIGIFDTGASAHLMGNEAAARAGLFSAGLVTSNTSIVSGVTGDTEVWISQPIGVFIDGLGAIEPSGLLLDRSGMMGQSNVAIAVGQGGAEVDLPTAIGSPLSVYFTAAFNNETQITVTRDGNDFTAPDIRIYEQDDPAIPNYSNIIPLELRPLGGASVQYLFDPFDLEVTPTSPSVIFGSILEPTQSIFFVSSVDMYEGSHSAIDKTRFMFDTGAQITVIGSRIGARLGIDPCEPEFEVEIQGVDGNTITAPGFYVDAIDIPALGEWLSFTNVPVVLLDAPSPEGGTVDGIIGMNLFTDLNFVVRGGGLFLQDDPTVEYEAKGLSGDIAPDGGDGVVDWLDLDAFVEAWLATPAAGNWNARADLVNDSVIDFLDFAVLAKNWMPQSN